MERAEPPSWDMAWLRSLLVYVRRHGVQAHEAKLLDSDAVSIRFEPHLAQPEILEGLLLVWPGVVAVERVGERMVLAHRQPPRRQHRKRLRFAGPGLRLRPR
ncbi:hypothetical protein Kisp01_71250 [Kineosporia sp. NBRC 101677]|uniref:hypothetical protein n=1 Tax=Kineosporia sp. NBRC 101677 TaxID=3032197 RepID=UPI00249F99AF|nr:hypothetical protein [Kineosporia sp. NBRC 101677]GLY20111.1 hypothetical protein Kisp01_71250 [Kineosporia sp. NBRC 101677]